MIPKIVHYVWVGNAPKPSSVLRCIASWERYLPDYQFIEWGNDALDQIDCEYAHQAFKARKWAFVSDYLRLYALYRHGGFYFDTDLELKASLESFRHHEFFCGFEIYKGRASPMTALLGSSQGSVIVSELLEGYAGRSFVQADGGLDLTANTLMLSDYIQSRFAAVAPYDPSCRLPLGSDSCIYPSHFFCTPEKDKENYAIHHFDGSWLDGYSRKELLRLAGITIWRLRRKNNNSTHIPLADRESKVIRIPLSGKYSLLLTRKGG